MAGTKKIRIHLSALTRREYTEVLEVPSDITASELRDLVNRRYDDVDGGDFTDDPHYWERGDCHADAAEQTDAPTGRVSRGADGHLEIRPDTANPGTISPSLRAELLAEKIERIKREILLDMQSGRVPATITSVGTLHEHVDANLYAGLGDDAELDRLVSLWGGTVQIGSMIDATPPDLQDFFNELQNAIHEWLAAGRPGEAPPSQITRA